MKTTYKVYVAYNAADTCRDPDDYSYVTVGYHDDLNEAVKLAEGYIKDHFFRKDTRLKPGREDDVVYHAIDFCSYGGHLRVKTVPAGLHTMSILSNKLKAIKEWLSDNT